MILKSAIFNIILT